MASNNISKYYKVDNGLDLTSDSQFATLSANEKIVYKPSGEKYIKNSNYPNVFDKTDNFGELEEKVDTNITKLEEKVDTNITKLEEKVDTKVISKIDDANTSGVCSCKNSNGTQVDTFKCHVPVNNSAPTLSWGQASTIGSIDGTPLTVKMPANPNTNTTYSAGTGLTLNGTTFSISQEILDKINNSGSTGSWPTFYFRQSGGLEVGDVVSGSKLFNDYNCTSSVGSGSWRLMWVNVLKEWVSGPGGDSRTSYYGKFQRVG